MNAQIRRLFLVIALLFVAVIAISTYWLWRSPDLEARQGNPTARRAPGDDQARPDLRRGRKDGAGAQPAAQGAGTDLVSPRLSAERSRRPHRRLLDRQPLARRPREVDERLPHGLEREPQTVVDRTMDKVRGLTQEGNTLVLTIDAEVPSAALRSCSRATCGAAVALEPQKRPRPRHGVVADLRPESRRGPNSAGSRAPGARDSRRRRFSTARPRALFIPGSTFKVITAAAALDTGRYTAESRLRRPRLLHRVRQAGLQLRRPERAGGLRPT